MKYIVGIFNTKLHINGFNTNIKIVPSTPQKHEFNKHTLPFILQNFSE